MSELHARLREILAALAASDPSCKRFGAAAHRYELAPPITAIEHAQIEERLGTSLPEDYQDYVTRMSAGGVGPYYGLIRADRAAAFAVAAPTGVAAWRHAVPLCHIGCGYAAVMPLDGPAAGQVWLDARQLAHVVPIRPSFTAFLLDWIDRVAHGQWLEAFVPPGRCAITAALSGYLAHCEQRLGLPEGSLDGDALRDALADLGPGAIAAAAEVDLPLFRAGDLLDPCVQCARALQGLFERHGLRSDVVQAGSSPLPAR